MNVIKKYENKQNFVKFKATKKGMTTIFLPLFVVVFGSGIRDPGSGMGKNQETGSGINIPDPQHWYEVRISRFLPKCQRSVTLFITPCRYSLFTDATRQLLQTEK
jgi:hypothetical protein